MVCERFLLQHSGDSSRVGLWTWACDCRPTIGLLDEHHSSKLVGVQCRLGCVQAPLDGHRLVNLVAFSRKFERFLA